MTPFESIVAFVVVVPLVCWWIDATESVIRMLRRKVRQS